jgi:hypothetical protein
MLENLTAEQFQALVGTRFRVVPRRASDVEVELYEVALHEPHDGPRVQPFSLRFRDGRGPGTPALPQQIFQVEHSTLGTMAIFLVPIGPDAQGMCYEAVFN